MLLSLVEAPNTLTSVKISGVGINDGILQSGTTTRNGSESGEDSISQSSTISGNIPVLDDKTNEQTKATGTSSKNDTIHGTATTTLNASNPGDQTIHEPDANLHTAVSQEKVVEELLTTDSFGYGTILQPTTTVNRPISKADAIYQPTTTNGVAPDSGEKTIDQAATVLDTSYHKEDIVEQSTAMKNSEDHSLHQSFESTDVSYPQHANACQQLPNSEGLGFNDDNFHEPVSTMEISEPQDHKVRRPTETSNECHNEDEMISQPSMTDPISDIYSNTVRQPTSTTNGFDLMEVDSHEPTVSVSPSQEQEKTIFLPAIIKDVTSQDYTTYQPYSVADIADSHHNTTNQSPSVTDGFNDQNDPTLQHVIAGSSSNIKLDDLHKSGTMITISELQVNISDKPIKVEARSESRDDNICITTMDVDVPEPRTDLVDQPVGTDGPDPVTVDTYHHIATNDISPIQDNHIDQPTTAVSGFDSKINTADQPDGNVSSPGDENILQLKAVSEITDSKDVPWYNPAPPRIPSAMRELLANYSGVPESEQVEHIITIREKAFAIHPYPCLGLYAFLRIHLPTSPLFPSIVEELQTKDDSLLLDLGTGLGQELRGLVAAGVPVEKIRGIELEASFNELGFELFKDKERLVKSMLFGDILLDHGPSSLEGFHGKATMLHAASFLHLWDWEGQIDVASRMVKLLQDRIGVRMLGRQIGSIKAHAKVHETNKNGKTMWKHDPESFERLWNEVGKKTGTKWKVNAELGKPYVKLDERTGQWWHDPDTRTIIWSIERIG